MSPRKVSPKTVASALDWTGSKAATGFGAVSAFSKSSEKVDKGFAKHVSCYHSHPALKMPGTELLIYGGSCYTPEVKDADLYVGFDAGMTPTKKAFPWNPGDEVFFPIKDMGVPSNVTEFKKMVQWVREQLEAGKKVHCGCIGGHGRTGMFFSALVSTFNTPDATTYVRENYCKKAVESTEQVKWLHEHFGITKVAGYKSNLGGHTYGKDYDWHNPANYKKTGDVLNNVRPRGEVFEPMPHPLSIWGPA